LPSDKKKDIRLIGVLSDTHGLLRDQVIENLSDVDLIIHAGDVGGRSIIDELKKISPVFAVRGNMDQDKWSQMLPRQEIVKVGNMLIYVLHSIYDLDLAPEGAGISMVIFGHSHQPALEKRNGVLYLNPGGAGPRRFDYPISVALLRVDGSKITPEILELDV
jgi:putative phosphoesterase